MKCELCYTCCIKMHDATVPIRVKEWEMAETGSVEGIFSGHGQVKTPTYKEQAYKLIKEAVLYQKFKPDAIYSQEAICQELGISRTPVREALLELQKEGYLLFCRGKGIQIVSLDQKAIHDILEMRVYLEKATAELAARRATEADVNEIAVCLDAQHQHLNSQDINLCYRLDHAFHRAVARASHNDLLYQALDEVLDHYLRFEVLTIYESYSGASAIWTEHNAIYSAIRAHDPAEAYKAAELHLQDAYKRTLEQYWHE